MDADRWRRVEQVLDVALCLEPAKWPSLLDERCAGEPELRRQVEALLARIGEARSFLSWQPSELVAAVLGETSDAIHTDEGRMIGAYRLLREIGRGGMARVFLAERADGHFEQQVALKLLRPGLDADVDRERFRAERQILASLNHPHIARLFDGGVTEEGQPYLVLEYVNGKAIDAFCGEAALSIRQRLELFLTVCDATQYAHRRLLVHRDLKPSNILVSMDGAVKLLDFGLAKLLEASSPAPQLTRTRQRWMTPEYAAPEQIQDQPVTTQTDVYQLGMVLYQLLAGRLPFSSGRASVHQLEEALLREEPEAPSAMLTRSASATAGNALRGDLDAIVLKALRKEPDERYASVEALADDVRRHLSAHPVRARGPSAGYRARRFIRRRRVETFAAVAIAASLLGGIVLSMTQARRAVAARDRAEAMSRESEAVTAFLLELFEGSDPEGSPGDSMTARDLLRRGVVRADQLRGEPAVQARMLETTGRVYRALGEYSTAQMLIGRALALRRGTGEEDGLEVAGTLRQLADGLLRLGRYAAADSVVREALAIQQRHLGAEHPAIAATLHQLGSLAIYRGDLAAAERYHRGALAIREQTLGARDSLTGDSHLLVGAILRRTGHPTDAEREFRQALAIHEAAPGRNDAQIANDLLQIAYLLSDHPARAAEAEPLYHRALEVRRRAHGNGHPLIAHTLLDFSTFLSRRGDHAAAVAISRQQVAALRRAYGPEHPVTGQAVGRLANTLYAAGLLDEADSVFRHVIALDGRLRGPDHPDVAGHEFGLARLLIDRGNYAAADTFVRDALRIRTHVHGVDALNVAFTRGLLGHLLARQGRSAAADSTLQHAIASMERQVGREHPDLRELYGWLADLHDARGRAHDAAR